MLLLLNAIKSIRLLPVRRQLCMKGASCLGGRDLCHMGPILKAVAGRYGR